MECPEGGNSARLLAPWLAILALLGLKPNRNLAAVWIIAPLGCIIFLTSAFPWALPSPANEIMEAIGCLAAGLAVAWLLAEHLRHRRRGLAFLLLLLAMALSGVLVFALRRGAEWQAASTMSAAILTTLAIVATALALSFCGRLCLNKYQPAKCYVGLLILLPISWFLISTPILIYGLMSGKDTVPWLEFFVVICACAAVNYATILPFLILSTANIFYHQRLLALLQLPVQSSSLTEVNLTYLIPEITKPQE